MLEGVLKFALIGEIFGLLFGTYAVFGTDWGRLSSAGSESF